MWRDALLFIKVTSLDRHAFINSFLVAPYLVFVKAAGWLLDF